MTRYSHDLLTLHRPFKFQAALAQESHPTWGRWQFHFVANWRRSCRFVTHAGNARSFTLCSLGIMIVPATEAYAGFRVGDDS
jgi:hypothetical protein